MTPRPPRVIPAATSPLSTAEALRPSAEGLVVGDVPQTARRPKKAAPEEQRTPFSTYLPEKLARQFKAACMLDGIPIQEGTEQAVRGWLESKEAQKQASQEKGKQASSEERKHRSRQERK